MNAISIAVASVLFLSCFRTLAQSPAKIKENISSTTEDSQLRSLINVNGTLYFAAKDSSHGIELWKSNGTDQGTVLVKDIYPGVSSSSPSSFVNLNGTLFFVANNGTYGTELWKSDGTSSGTVLVKDIYEGKGSSSPSFFAQMNGTLYFSANDSIHSSELWKSDGTSKGTVLVKDINMTSRNIVRFSPLPTISEPVSEPKEWPSNKKIQESSPAPSAPRRQGLPPKRAVLFPSDKK